jgi:hypothetical protein
MKYLKLSVPSGVKWHGTAYQCEGRWYDANLMRWDQGAMLPVGGWVTFLDSKPGDWDDATDGLFEPSPVKIPDTMVPREAHSWFLNDATGANGAGYYPRQYSTHEYAAHRQALETQDPCPALGTLSRLYICHHLLRRLSVAST